MAPKQGRTPLKQTEDLKQKARAWLLQHQEESGGWAERPGGAMNVLNTAEAMLALFASGIDAGDPAIRGGVKYLLAHGRDVPEEDRGAWGRNVQDSESIQHIPDLVRTSLAIRALIKAGRQDETAVKDAAAWLLDIQNRKKDESGWGYRRGARSEFMPTCFALQSLIEAHGAQMEGDLKKSIDRGLSYLIAQQNPAAGSFGPSDAMIGARTIAAVLTLQAAAKCNLSVYAVQEKLAIQWVLANPTESRAVVEEIATIDPNEDGNYGVLYMPKLLTVRFQGLPDEALHELLLDFNENFDDNSGGFYGRRIFSWSTAQALQALSASGLKTLPEPEPVVLAPTPEPEQVPARFKLVIGFIVTILLLATIVVLALAHIIEGVLAFTLVAFVLFASLLTLGAIKEGAFVDLIKATLDALKELSPGGSKSKASTAGKKKS
jgi:Squalene-hopene cyclase C-terminal domain